MAESLSAFIARIKTEHEQRTKQHKGTLNFFLEQIRDLAAKAMPERLEAEKDKEQLLQSSKSVEKAHATSMRLTPGRARTQVINNYVLQSSGSMSRSYLGRMMFFKYDAKLKQKLPYWDRYPIAFLISVEGNSALGINLHYLPPVERAKLLYNLMTISNTEKLDKGTKLIMTYKLLKESSKFRGFKPCIKRYLFNHIQSQVMVIDATKWTEVIFLPLAEFVKADEFKVWQDSIAKMRNDTSSRQGGRN